MAAVRFAFWNAGVAPTRGHAHRSVDVATTAVDEMFGRGIQLVALAEVDRESIAAIKTALESPSIASLEMTGATGGSRWDLAVLYSSRELTCRPAGEVTGRRRGTTHRAAWKVSVAADDWEALTYLLHWRSRRLSNGYDYRRECAVALHTDVRDSLGRDRSVIVMGDFNDEPFDSSIERELNSLRDPRLVIKRSEDSLFNPCWPLCAPQPADPWSGFGTYQSDRPRTTSRYQFDQVMTSAHFLDEAAGAAPTAHRLMLESLLIDGRHTDHIPIELRLPSP